MLSMTAVGDPLLQFGNMFGFFVSKFSRHFLYPRVGGSGGNSGVKSVAIPFAIEGEFQGMIHTHETVHSDPAELLWTHAIGPLEIYHWEFGQMTEPATFRGFSQMLPGEFRHAPKKILYIGIAQSVHCFREFLITPSRFALKLDCMTEE